MSVFYNILVFKWVITVISVLNMYNILVGILHTHTHNSFKNNNIEKNIRINTGNVLSLCLLEVIKLS